MGDASCAELAQSREDGDVPVAEAPPSEPDRRAPPKQVLAVADALAAQGADLGVLLCGCWQQHDTRRVVIGDGGVQPPQRVTRGMRIHACHADADLRACGVVRHRWGAD